MKVRALRTGYYIDVRFRGDDTLGKGNGDIFTLADREVTEYDHQLTRPMIDKETGKAKMKLLTAEQQFSAIWMERMPDDTDDRVTSAQDALSLANEDIAASKRPKRRA